jgi:exodeoxyribonuclease VII small subunit
LEQIAEQLETGDLPLERALQLFEEGVGLARSCQSQLQDAERKVEMLLRERGEIKVVPFDSVKDAQMSNSESSPITSAASPGSNVPRLEVEEDSEDADETDDAIPF